MSGSVITYMVVDFPAPLWPNKAVTSPRRNSMVRSLTAVLVTPLDSRKTLVKFSRRTPSKLWECIDGPLDSDAFSLGDGWEIELRCVEPPRLFHNRWRWKSEKCKSMMAGDQGLCNSRNLGFHPFLFRIVLKRSLGFNQPTHRQSIGISGKDFRWNPNTCILQWVFPK